MAEKRPIIIKKIKKGGHAGHHGGAWKVAYADFVTAMMAFFLLMWLLNATSETQKRGISNYFGPAGDMIGAGGSGGILGGVAIDSEGNYDDNKLNSSTGSDSSKAETTKDVDGDGNTNKPPKIEDPPEGGLTEQAKLVQNQDQTEAKSKEKLQSEAREKAVAELVKKENDMFKEAEHMIRQAIQDTPDLKDLAQNLIVENTSEGLRIQIVDRERFSMFPNGKADMYPTTKELIQKVAKVISQLPNKISIAGHTDAKAYSGQSNYTNWELSTDRANATRRELSGAGFPADRIMNVVGKADREPFVPNNPMDDQNRRISITLLRNQQQIVEEDHRPKK